MKKSITSILALALVTVSNAQLTLTSANTPHSPTYDDDRNFIVGAAAPQHGENMIYDYSTFITTETDEIPYMPADRAGYTQFTRFNYGFTLLGQIPLYAEYYTHKDATGVYRGGSYKLPQSESVGAISGNNQDTLSFPGSDSFFENPNYLIKFPATFGSSWSSEFIFDIDFNLTVAAFGLNNVPGKRVQYCTQMDSVVGSGTLKLPGGSLGSFEYPVILVKKTIMYIDSTFLGGAPAPAAILSAFGLTQGSTSSVQEYTFYAADFERPLMIFTMASDWQTVTECYYAPKGLEYLSTNSIDATNAQIYPNPINSGDVLNVAINSAIVPTQIRILSLNGQEILNENISEMNNQSFSIRIPNAASGGIYICQVIDENGAIILNNKISITE